MSYEPYPERVKRLRKQRRKRRREDLLVNIMAGGVVVGSIVALVVGLTLLFSLPIFLAWNLGVVGISHAVGGHIHHISYWVALGASLAIGAISRIFRPGGISVKR